MKRRSSQISLSSLRLATVMLYIGFHSHSGGTAFLTTTSLPTTTRCYHCHTNNNNGRWGGRIVTVNNGETSWKRQHSRYQWRHCDSCIGLTKNNMIDATKSSTSSNNKNDILFSSRGVKDRLPDNRKPNIKFDLLPDFMQKDPLLMTKQKWKMNSSEKMFSEDNTNANNRLASSSINSSSHLQRRKGEMMAMSAVSIALAIGVVYVLASNGPSSSMSSSISSPDDFLLGSSSTATEFQESGNVVREIFQENNAERLEIATRNIVKTVLPQSAEDVIAISIGEGLAGAIGAFATWFLGMILNLRNNDEFLLRRSSTSMMNNNRGMTRLEAATRDVTNGSAMGIMRQSNYINDNTMDSLVSEAVADGDYFLTRAAAQPLLEAAGIPIVLASLASILIATLPYEAVKLTSQKRKREIQEQVLLEILLEEEEQRRRGMNVIDIGSNKVFDFLQKLNVRQPANVNIKDVMTTNDDGMNMDVTFVKNSYKNNVGSNRQGVTAGKVVPGLDYVELFADITKWLEYDVLISNYRGILTMPNGQMLSTASESAIFGLLAAFSSQLYTDVLYLYSDFGNPQKREQTINRSLEGWASIYTTKCLSTATLFGVYEGVRAPISRLLSQLLSGGVGGCIGSADFDLCMETYLIDNPSPSASWQADIRASIVAAVNSLDSFSWLLPLNDQETMDSFVRGVIVSVYSELGKTFHML